MCCAFPSSFAFISDPKEFSVQNRQLTLKSLTFSAFSFKLHSLFPKFLDIYKPVCPMARRKNYLVNRLSCKFKPSSAQPRSFFSLSLYISSSPTHILEFIASVLSVWGAGNSPIYFFKHYFLKTCFSNESSKKQVSNL